MLEEHAHACPSPRLPCTEPRDVPSVWGGNTAQLTRLTGGLRDRPETHPLRPPCIRCVGPAGEIFARINAPHAAVQAASKMSASAYILHLAQLQHARAPPKFFRWVDVCVRECLHACACMPALRTRLAKCLGRPLPSSVFPSPSSCSKFAPVD